MSFITAAFALLLENLFGYPRWLERAIRHPVKWMGDVIAYLDRLLNTRTTDKLSGRANGLIALGIVILVFVVPAILLQLILMKLSFGWAVIALLATPFLAQASLRDHVGKVKVALDDNVTEARKEVAKIVGRDPSRLDESEIAKAALESLAENTSDGVVAPAFWLAIAGLPGIVAYKVINTADSMIGHKNETYLHFGWASAKLDDLVNLPASRLTALLIAAVSWISDKQLPMRVWRVAWSDAPKHASPNAGWPEAAMAAALNLKFGGPRDYQGETIDLPHMGNGREVMSRSDISAGLALYDKLLLALSVIFALVGMILSAPWASLLP